MENTYLFTSESVGEGHPDKLADQISDAVLDDILSQDKNSRVACETMVSTGFVIVAGEITTNAYADIPEIARRVIKEVGYTEAPMGIDGNSCAILTSIDKQSPDIAMGVDEGSNKEQGAGDQGMMFGYACNETDQLMPATITYAHKLVENLAVMRRSGNYNFLRPDCKSQVTAQYINDKLHSIDTVVISTQHSADVSMSTLKEAVIEELIKKTLPVDLLTKNTKFLVNPTGRFVVGGPQGDCGLTGRKIIVDTYGGHGAHGGGAFSGKDPSKVDRSAAYMARYVAKHVVASGIAQKALVQVSYAIGCADPVSVYVNTFNTGKIDDMKIMNAITKTFSFKPKSIIETFDLLRPLYRKTAAYGHFGRAEFPWEKLDKIEQFKNNL